MAKNKSPIKEKILADVGGDCYRTITNTNN
jgi:hypothetical protein